jgi:hypothetical protein
LKCTVDHILQEFNQNTLFLTRFRTYKITSPPQTKMTSKDDIKGLVSLKFLLPCTRVKARRIKPSGREATPLTRTGESLTRAATPHQKRRKLPASNTQTTSEEDWRPPMAPTHTAGLPPLVTLRIGDAAAYRTGEEAADRKTATNKGTSGPVTGSKASEMT